MRNNRTHTDLRRLSLNTADLIERTDGVVVRSNRTGRVVETLITADRDETIAQLFERLADEYTDASGE